MVDLSGYLSCFSVHIKHLLLWPPYGIGQVIIFLSCVFFFLSIFPFCFPRLISAVADWMSTILLPFYAWCGPSVNLECRSEMCWTWLAGNAEPKKSPSGHHCTTSSGYIFATKARIDNRKKNLLKSNIFPTYSCNIVNFRPNSGEIGSLVWGTPANFNRFRVLASLLHDTLVVGVSQTGAMNSRRRVYSAGQPSRWPLAHILVVTYHVPEDFAFVLCSLILPFECVCFIPCRDVLSKNHHVVLCFLPAAICLAWRFVIWRHCCAS